MRTLALGPSVELPIGPRTVRGVRQNGAAVPCGPSHWGLRWSSLWGHEPCEGRGAHDDDGDDHDDVDDDDGDDADDDDDDDDDDDGRRKGAAGGRNAGNRLFNTRTPQPQDGWEHILFIC